ncbi:MAG: 23S rRNA (pseudouridine(1915)-N(3))-methyltransferase RlmH [Myxococcota bacterium]|jgi:23S rRNA (pseudouridine1915-N3)-methyltransferase|nr:23S rRNA (pseudouridine(1915)-N(3))-methyltransferase RlmH [Myxococcota bacterium]
MRVQILTVGRPRDRGLSGLCETYLRRCAPLLRTDWSVVSAGDPRGSNRPERAIAAEEQRLLKRLDSDAVIVALDEGGKRRDSRELARWLGRLRDDGRRIQLVVGGAFGLGPELRRRCHQQISLSPLTLPHELALLILTEQLYRAKTILAGEPYHH